jgi:hypothetical protein
MPSIITLFALAVVVIYFGKRLFKSNKLVIDKQLKNEGLNLEDRYNLTKVAHRKEVDRILEKIAKHGMESLTKKEKEML